MSSELLDCANPIDRSATLPGGYTAVLGALGFDATSTLGIDRTSSGDTRRYFVKTGLAVRAGRVATVSLSPDWVKRVNIGWGNNGKPIAATQLRISGCADQSGKSDGWLAYPGGLTLDRAACVPLRIHVDTRVTEVHISAGIRCP